MPSDTQSRIKSVSGSKMAQSVHVMNRKSNGIKCPKCGGSGKVEDPAVVGAKMRKARELSGIALHSVAKRMSFSAPYISDLEHGRRSWSPYLIQAYQEALK